MPKFKVILSDVPWLYNDKREGYGGSAPHYASLSTEDLAKLPVKEISDDDCILFFWTTFPFLPEALHIMESWGFKYKTVGFVWIKLNTQINRIIGQIREFLLNPGIENLLAMFKKIFFYGIGSYTRSNVEVCLIGIKGRPAVLNKNISQLIVWPKSKHSEKPKSIMSKIVEMMGDVPRIEIFSREKVEGWEVLGNEIDGRDIRESIKDYIEVTT